MGRGERELAARLATHGLVLVLGFTIVASILLFVFSNAVFALLGAEGRTLDLVNAYVAIWCIGFPGFGLAMIGSLLMRSFGDPAYPGMVMAAGSVVQVLVGPVLIFGLIGFPALGMEGAAWAFVLARTVSLAMTAYWFFFKEGAIRPEFGSFAESSKAILHVGLPATATNLIQPLSAAVTTWLLAGLGTAVVAGFGVAARIDSVVSMVIIGISASTGPLVGQNWGAGEYDRVAAAMRLCTQFCLGWSVIAATIMWLGAAFFVGLINDDPELTDAATSFLYIVPVSLGFMGMVSVATGAFNALSRPIPPLILTISQLLLIYVPIAVFAGRQFGYQGVFAATAISNVAAGLVGWRWSRTMVRTERLRMESSAGGQAPGAAR